MSNDIELSPFSQYFIFSKSLNENRGITVSDTFLNHLFLRGNVYILFLSTVSNILKMCQPPFLDIDSHTGETYLEPTTPPHPPICGKRFGVG